MSDMQETINAAIERHNALSPIDRAIHDLKQRRSMAIGLSDFDSPVEPILAHIDAMPEYVVLAELERLRAQLAKARADVIEECFSTGRAAVEACEPDPNIIVRGRFGRRIWALLFAPLRMEVTMATKAQLIDTLNHVYTIIGPRDIDNNLVPASRLVHMSTSEIQANWVEPSVRLAARQIALVLHGTKSMTALSHQSNRKEGR